MSDFAEQLRRLRFLPEPAASEDEFVARVMAACEAAPVKAAPRAASRRAVWAAGAVLAAAACVALGVTAWPSQAPKPEVIAARGSEPGLSATVQAFVGHARAGSAPPLLEGATLRPGDGILVRYSNPTERDVYLMVFALDARHAVHWIHPAYLSEDTNPSSLRLARGVTERVLPEVAEPEAPAPGALRVYALLSAAPLDVKGVEQRLAGARQAVPALFPEAETEEWSCTWAP
jgi:hypothetical protein